jgi:hypothetical protein
MDIAGVDQLQRGRAGVDRPQRRLLRGGGGGLPKADGLERGPD